MRSVCGSTGCVATASRRTGQTTSLATLVFDDVGGRWVAVDIGSGMCNKASGERWEMITLQPRPDGNLSGEYVDVAPAGCALKRTLTFTRTGDVDVVSLPDPASQAPRVASPAEALHGGYHYTSTFTDGSKNDWDFVGRTDCLRSGERCITYFHSPKGGLPLVFANGKWVDDRQYDHSCTGGGTSHVRDTSNFPLPQPPQDPITQLTGHGHLEGSGTACPFIGDFDARFVRTGD